MRSAYLILHSLAVILPLFFFKTFFFTPFTFFNCFTFLKHFFSLYFIILAAFFAPIHTYTHPFYWGKIKNNSLDLKYRLKVKNYDFSIERELSQSIDDINRNLQPMNRAKTVFWSGDCSPRVNALSHIYKNGILNINGGDTTITKTNPWLGTIAPLGIERDGYYQVYTGAQNENVYTNDWLGPFWGFKRVVQTFKLTNSPRRFKPIDIYYHIYSGSKQASLGALKYVFNWALKQDVMPIFTSEYIPKVMDYYTVSMAKENNEWLIEGMKNLKTIRIEEKNTFVDFEKSKSSLGVKHFENHTYISLDTDSKHLISTSKRQNKKVSYLISSNGRLVEYKNDTRSKYFLFEGYVDLKLDFYLASGCTIESKPKAKKILEDKSSIKLLFKHKKVSVQIECKNR